jgi:predicted ABC-type ATPase
MQGGHTVPIEKIVSRYSRSMANLRIAFELANRVYVYDNSPEGEDAVLTARVQDGQLRKIYGRLPSWVADALADLPRHEDFVDLREA